MAVLISVALAVGLVIMIIAFVVVAGTNQELVEENQALVNENANLSADVIRARSGLPPAASDQPCSARTGAVMTGQLGGAKVPQQTESDPRPTVLSIASRTEKTYTIRLAGCAPRPWPYSNTRTYRPTRLTVVKRDGNVDKVELSGPQIKKDGTEGQQSTREWLHRQKDWPSWLASIVGGLA